MYSRMKDKILEDAASSTQCKFKVTGRPIIFSGSKLKKSGMGKPPRHRKKRAGKLSKVFPREKYGFNLDVYSQDYCQPLYHDGATSPTKKMRKQLFRQKKQPDVRHLQQFGQYKVTPRPTCDSDDEDIGTFKGLEIHKSE